MLASLRLTFRRVLYAAGAQNICKSTVGGLFTAEPLLFVECGTVQLPFTLKVATVCHGVQALASLTTSTTATPPTTNALSLNLEMTETTEFPKKERHSNIVNFVKEVTNWHWTSGQ